MLAREQKEMLIEMLAIIYASIPWKKIRTSKNPHDIWNHRLRAAATRATLGEFVSALCNRFGLQSLPAEVVPLIDQLEPVGAELLDEIYREHIPIAMRAVLRAKTRRRAPGQLALAVQEHQEATDENDSD